MAGDDCAQEAEGGQVRSTEQVPVLGTGLPKGHPRNLCPQLPLGGFHEQIETLRKCTNKTPPPFNKRKKSQVKTELLILCCLHPLALNKQISLLVPKKIQTTIELYTLK